EPGGRRNGIPRGRRTAGKGKQPPRADRGQPARAGSRSRGARQRPARVRHDPAPARSGGYRARSPPGDGIRGAGHGAGGGRAPLGTSVRRDQLPAVLRRPAEHSRNGKGETGTVRPRVIAIDGPAASGKSSTAAAVARRLGWAHLDSGALYRAVTLAVLDNLRDAGSGMRDAWPPQQVVALAEDLPVRLVLVGDAFRPTVAGVDVEETIRSERVTRHVSAIAAIREVRNWVNVQQREAVAGEIGRASCRERG